MVMTVPSPVAALYLWVVDVMPSLDHRVWAIVLVCATVSSIAGFAFSALAGAALFHVTQDKLHVVQIMLVASIALQLYSVWKLRCIIEPRGLLPYFAGGIATIPPGIYLLLNTPVAVYVGVLGALLMAYAVLMLVRPPLRLKRNSLLGRVVVGALGGLTGTTAAFPGAFVTIWCNAQAWDKAQQRAIYQPFILGMQLLTLLALALAQPAQGLRLDALQFAIPALLGAYIGLRVFDKLSTVQFNRVIASLLLLSGASLLAKTFPA